MLGLHSYFLKQNKQQDSFIPLGELMNYLALFDEETFSETRNKTIPHWMNTRWLASEMRKIGLVKGAAQQRKFLGRNVKGYDVNYSELKRRMRIHGLNLDAEAIN